MKILLVSDKLGDGRQVLGIFPLRIFHHEIQQIKSEIDEPRRSQGVLRQAEDHVYRILLKQSLKQLSLPAVERKHEAPARRLKLRAA